MFCEVIGEIGWAGGPENSELALCDTVADPIESHVDGLGSDLFDGSIDDATGGGVVSCNWGSWLWVAHFLEGGTKDSALLGIVKEGPNFGFSSGGHDSFDDFGDIDDGAIEHRSFAGEVAEVEVAAGSAAGFRFGEVSGITVDV